MIVRPMVLSYHNDAHVVLLEPPFGHYCRLVQVPFRQHVINLLQDMEAPFFSVAEANVQHLLLRSDKELHAAPTDLTCPFTPFFS